MIVEVRDYRTKPGKRDEFVKLFQERTAPLQQQYGMLLFGLLLDQEDPDRLFWLRGFASEEERQRLRGALYSSDEWIGELEQRAMPLFISMDYRLAELTDPFVDDFAGQATGRR